MLFFDLSAEKVTSNCDLEVTVKLRRADVSEGIGIAGVDVFCFPAWEKMVQHGAVNISVMILSCRYNYYIEI